MNYISGLLFLLLLIFIQYYISGTKLKYLLAICSIFLGIFKLFFILDAPNYGYAVLFILLYFILFSLFFIGLNYIFEKNIKVNKKLD